MGEYGVLETKVMVPEGEIKEQLFTKEGTIMPMNLMYLDVPHMFCNTKVGMDLMYTLAKVENIELFQKKSVQILIDNQYAYWYKRSRWLFGYPLVAQLVIFWYWSNIVITG